MNSYQDMDFRVRDRILLYARGLNLSPRESVELALESLKRCSSDHPDYEEALVCLHAILAEKGRELIPGDDAPHLMSAPGMTRSSMLAEELDRTPWISIFKKTLSRLFRIFPSGIKERASWKDSAERQRRQMEWERVAGRRRSLLMTLILVPAVIGAYLMYSILPQQGVQVHLSLAYHLLHLLGGWGVLRCGRGSRRGGGGFLLRLEAGEELLYRFQGDEGAGLNVEGPLDGVF